MLESQPGSDWKGLAFLGMFCVCCGMCVRETVVVYAARPLMLSWYKEIRAGQDRLEHMR